MNRCRVIYDKARLRVGVVALWAGLAGGDPVVQIEAVSRNVWRGGDLGNSPAVQPLVDQRIGPMTAWAWGSIPVLDRPQAQQINTGLSWGWWTLKNYHFPGTGALTDGASHRLELLAAPTWGPWTLLGAQSMAGDGHRSTYLEGAYQGAAARGWLGAGRGLYAPDWTWIAVGGRLRQGAWWVEGVMNPHSRRVYYTVGWKGL